MVFSLLVGFATLFRAVVWFVDVRLFSGTGLISRDRQECILLCIGHWVPERVPFLREREDGSLFSFSLGMWLIDVVPAISPAVAVVEAMGSSTISLLFDGGLLGCFSPELIVLLIDSWFNARFGFCLSAWSMAPSESMGFPPWFIGWVYLLRSC